MNISLTSGSLNVPLEVTDGTSVLAAESATCNFADSLNHPIGLPPIPECVVPGDRVTIAVDPDTPELVELIAEIWQQLQGAEFELNITVLLPADFTGGNWNGLQEQLPAHVREQASIHIHDPDDEQQRRYLASSAGGERLYLSHHLTDADLIISVGTFAPDSVLGHRGTNSALFPAFSDTQAIVSLRQSETAELGTDQQGKARELADEVGWLLGTQFTVQAVGAADGSIGQLFCGAVDRVTSVARNYLAEQYRFKVDTQHDIAVVSVPVSESGFGWKNLGRALTAIHHVVEDGGRVAVVADLPTPDGPANEMLRRCTEPSELLKPLVLEPPEDGVETARLIQAMDQWNVFLLSNLPDGIVEEFGLLPLSNADEVQKLLSTAEYPVIIPGANLAAFELTTLAAR